MMDTKTAEILCNINNDFYRSYGESFSETRKAPWQGWVRCLSEIKRVCGNDADEDGEGIYSEEGDGARGVENAFASDGTKLSVFDLACGNLRFETFLEQEFSDRECTFYAVDNCDSLLPPQPHVQYQNFNVLGSLFSGRNIENEMKAPPCDLSVSFGFMHHIPHERFRRAVLQALLAKTKSGGFVSVSFWRFMEDAAMAEKARATHSRALEDIRLAGLGEALDENDMLLGWKGMPGAYRYCHSFTEGEIDRLCEAIAGTATVVARYRADGRTGELNEYVVLRVLS